MQGTRTCSRTHTTPPLKRRESVAPAGCPAFRQRLCDQRASGLSGSFEGIDFRAGRQHGQFSVLEARSS